MIDEKQLLVMIERDRKYCEYQAKRYLESKNELMEYGYNCEINRIDKVISYVKSLLN